MIPLLHIRNSDIYGSPERLIIGQMNHLNNFQSYCATFVPPGSSTPFYDQLTEQNLRGIAIQSSGQIDRTIVKQLREIITKKNIQLLVSHDYKANFYTYLANRKPHLPHIGYYHGRTDENLKVKLYNFVDTKVLSRLQRIITVSKATSRYLVEKGVDENRIEIVYNAIEINDSYTVNQKPADSPVIVGVIGRLSHEKGVQVLLDALALVKDKLPPVEFRIFGDGPERSALEKQAVTKKLDDIVSFKGFVTDLNLIYGNLDMMVIPSLSEGHPLIILEAWKQAIGIVATKAGGVPEVITDGQTGLLAEVNNPESLGKRILDGLTNMQQTKQLGQNGLAELKQKYSYTAQAEQLQKLYNRIITDK